MNGSYFVNTMVGSCEMSRDIGAFDRLIGVVIRICIQLAQKSFRYNSYRCFY